MKKAWVVGIITLIVLGVIIGGYFMSNDVQKDDYNQGTINTEQIQNILGGISESLNDIKQNLDNAESDNSIK
jgi:hypothetical protein